MSEHAKKVNDRCDALVKELEEECVIQGHAQYSHEYYAALCGKMKVYLLIEMSGHDFWKEAHNEALKVCSY